VKLRGCKLVWTVHNLGDHEKKQQKFEIFAHRLLARLSDQIIVHSKFAKKKVIEKYQLSTKSDRVQIIPHGNYLGNYPNTLAQKEARNLLELPVDCKVFLFLGQIRPYKGIPELLDAFTQIAGVREILIIAGNTEDQLIHANLVQRSQETTSIRYFPGFVPDEKIQEYMHAADVVVFPFRDILTSGSILLAMSFGKAIIIPGLESLEEVIEVGGAMTFRPEETDGLKMAMKSALTRDLKKLGDRNLNAAKALSWEIIAEQTVSIYYQPSQTSE